MIAWLRRRLVRWGWLEPECLSDEQRLITSEEINEELDRVLGIPRRVRHVGYLSEQDMAAERAKRLGYKYTRSVSEEEQAARRDKVLEMDFTPARFARNGGGTSSTGSTDGNKEEAEEETT